MTEPDQPIDVETYFKLAQAFEPVLDTAAGIRESAKAKGFDETSANAMGAAFYGSMVAMMWASATAQEQAKYTFGGQLATVIENAKPKG